MQCPFHAAPHQTPLPESAPLKYSCESYHEKKHIRVAAFSPHSVSHSLAHSLTHSHSLPNSFAPFIPPTPPSSLSDVLVYRITKANPMHYVQSSYKAFNSFMLHRPTWNITTICVWSNIIPVHLPGNLCCNMCWLCPTWHQIRYLPHFQLCLVLAQNRIRNHTRYTTLKIELHSKLKIRTMTIKTCPCFEHVKEQA